MPATALRPASELDRLRQIVGQLMHERRANQATIAALTKQVEAFKAIPATGRRGEAVCGTYTGYKNHRRDGETPCPACKTAQTIYQREYRKKKEGAH